ncbi:amino acid permease [Candidatus Pantoea multigeneris]|nr:amino acid permease [Pantoea multigeneris]
MSAIGSETIKGYMVATIGVSIVIAGQFSGWNLGLVFGWKNMLAGALLMLVFYLCFLQLVAEMGSTWPSAGGLAKYTAAAFGKLPGGMVNVAMATALVAGTGIVGSFIAAYAQSITGFDATTIKVMLFVAVLMLHLAGSKEAMWLVLLAGLVAVMTLVVFSGISMPHFQPQRLGDTPFSWHSMILALPFALWLFVGVEQAVTTSEEVRDPGRDLPRGLMLSLLILTITGSGVLLFAPGLAGTTQLAQAGDPLLAALDSVGLSRLHLLIGAGAVFGLIASFFSLTWSASRQLFDLARSGFVPSYFATCSRKGTPVPAISLVMALGFGVSFINLDKVLVAMVVLFTASYFLTTLAWFRLRQTQAQTPRPYRAFGGHLTATLSLMLSVVIFYACFSGDISTLLAVGAVFALVLAWHTLKRKSYLPTPG